MKRNHMNMLEVLTMALILTPCGGKDDENRVRAP